MIPPIKFPTPASLIFLVVGLGVGGLAGWYAAPRSGNVQTVGERSGEGSTGNYSDRSGPRNPDSDRAASSGKTNASATPKDLEKTVRSIFRENVKERRVAMFEKMAGSVGIERFPDLVALVRENDLRGNDTGDEWSRLWTSWAKRDPISAMNFVSQFDWSGWDPAARAHARNTTLSNWAQIDPQAVRKFVEEGKELANGDRQMVKGFVEGWSIVDPKAAADWLIKTGLGKSAEFESVVQEMTRSGNGESVDVWFAGLDPAAVPADDMKGFARAIVRQKLEYEPEKAAAWLEKNREAPWVQDREMVGNTARAFAGQNPQAAMEWAGKTGFEGAAVYAMDAWCQNNLDAANQWLNENLENPAYTDSAQVVMAHLQDRDPAAARRWAESMKNKALGEQLLKQYGNQ